MIFPRCDTLHKSDRYLVDHYLQIYHNLNHLDLIAIPMIHCTKVCNVDLINSRSHLDRQMLDHTDNIDSCWLNYLLAYFVSCRSYIYHMTNLYERAILHSFYRPHLVSMCEIPTRTNMCYCCRSCRSYRSQSVKWSRSCESCASHLAKCVSYSDIV